MKIIRDLRDLSRREFRSVTRIVIEYNMYIYINMYYSDDVFMACTSSLLYSGISGVCYIMVWY